MIQQFPGDIPRRTERKVSEKSVSHVHSSIVHNSRKEETTQCPSMGEWINHIWFIHTMEYYSVFKEKQILHATTYTNLEKRLSAK